MLLLVGFQDGRLALFLFRRVLKSSLRLAFQGDLSSIIMPTVPCMAPVPPMPPVPIYMVWHQHDIWPAVPGWYPASSPAQSAWLLDPCIVTYESTLAMFAQDRAPKSSRTVVSCPFCRSAHGRALLCLRAMLGEVHKVTIHCVFPMICGSREPKSNLAKAAGAKPSGQMGLGDEKLHAVVAQSTFPSQNVQNTAASEQI